MKPSPENQLLQLGEEAAKAFAEGIGRLNSLVGTEGTAYSVRLVRPPELCGSNWMFVVDVVFPGNAKSIEFSVVQTGWGGFEQFSYGPGETEPLVAPEFEQAPNFEKPKP